MKHIKKFNESNSDYYSDITKEDYFRLISIKVLPFNDHEKKILSDMGYNVTSTISLRQKNNEFPPFKIMTLIKKLYDDWYLVIYDSSNEPTRYYKCDQLDGLLKLLEVLHKWPN